MPLIFNGTEIDDLIFNGTEQDELIYNGVTVWEKWKPWNASGRSPSSGYSDYSLNYTYTYSVPTNVKVKSISLTGYCQKVNEENLVNAIIKVYYDGAWHQVAEGGAAGYESSTSWENSNDYQITQIQFVASGLTLPKALSWSVSGFSKKGEKEIISLTDTDGNYLYDNDDRKIIIRE